mmetsp:Transcript_6601/g.9655  ORF Transcript_6601/g.9655 Transcript_6601/m.9655 type:complete len:82 (+) Transcript_6601:978-1223(+)
MVDTETDEAVETRPLLENANPDWIFRPNPTLVSISIRSTTPTMMQQNKLHGDQKSFERTPYFESIHMGASQARSAGGEVGS